MQFRIVNAEHAFVSSEKGTFCGFIETEVSDLQDTIQIVNEGQNGQTGTTPNSKQ